MMNKTKKEKISKEKFLDDLEKAFLKALEDGSFPAAIKAKELQGKCQGFLQNKSNKKQYTLAESQDTFNVSEISQNNLEKFLENFIEEVGNMINNIKE